MTQLNLSGVKTDVDDKGPKEPKEANVKPAFFREVPMDGSRRSTASYRAFRSVPAEDKFLLARLPHLGWDMIPLGRIDGRERANRMLDWWVEQDMRVEQILNAQDKGISHHETIEDMMIECAHAVPKPAAQPIVIYTCAQCQGQHGYLYEVQYTYEDQAGRKRRATRYLHDSCLCKHMLAAKGQSFWSTGEVMHNRIDETITRELEEHDRAWVEGEQRRMDDVLRTTESEGDGSERRDAEHSGSV